MKRQLGLLSFLLVGLVFIEWGCKDDNFNDGNGCGSIHLLVKEDSIALMEIVNDRFSEKENNTPVHYDSLHFRCRFLTEEVALNSNYGFTAYALTPAPCISTLSVKLDSIRAFRKDNNVEITNAFNIWLESPPLVLRSFNNDQTSLSWLNRENGHEIRYESAHPNVIDLLISDVDLINPFGHPDPDQEFAIRFKFYFENGKRYEMVSPPLTLTY